MQDLLSKILILLCIFMISGCVTRTVYVNNKKFPDIPEEIIIPCDSLELADEKNPKLSNLLETILENYKKYSECSLKVDFFNEWYNEQRELYNKAGK